MENNNVTDLEQLSKHELQEQVRLLQKRVAETDCAPNDCNECSTLHELQVHQLELEMQNRELRETQRLLEETRDKYADLYDFAPVSYISFDDKGVITNINLTGASMLGEVRSNIIGKPFSRWVDKSSLSLFYKHLATTFDSENKVVDEFTVKKINGQILNVQLESIRGLYSSNDDHRCRSIILDITESTRIKNEILLKARQLKLITDALPVLIAYLDIKEQHLFANKTYDISFDFIPEEIIGMSAKDVWGEKVYRNVKNHLKLALSGHPATFDMELPFKDEQKKYFNATLIPDWDKDNHIQGVIVLIGDITDRLAIEAIDRKRLLDIAHFSRLSSMGEMASEIAHELNQPLAAISIYSDACRRLLTSGNADQKQIIESLGQISEQAERAGVVIKKIREFVTKNELDKVTINLNDIVEDALKLLAVEIRSYQVKLKVSLSDDMPDIVVDKILVEQVIFNLIRNALEAMSEIEGERLLYINTAMNTLNEVEFIIEDSGPGLATEEGIFQAFHTTKQDGMGMGLAISHSIIQAHRGQLKTRPSQYGGARFCFALPIEG